MPSDAIYLTRHMASPVKAKRDGELGVDDHQGVIIEMPSLTLQFDDERDAERMAVAVLECLGWSDLRSVWPEEPLPQFGD